MLRPEQERVRQLLTEAVTLLCRNSLHFEEEVTVEGLLGITLDRHDIFLVSIRETVKQALKEVAVSTKGEKRAEVESEDSQSSQSAKRRKMLEHRRDSGGTSSRKSPSPQTEPAVTVDTSGSDRTSSKNTPNIKREKGSDLEQSHSASVDERKFNPAHDSTSLSVPSDEPTPDSVRQQLDFSQTTFASDQPRQNSSHHQPHSDSSSTVQVKQEQEEAEDEEECYMVDSDSEDHSDNSHSSSMPQHHTWPTSSADGGFNLSELDLLAAQQFSQSPQQFGNLSAGNMPFPMTGEMPVAGPSTSVDGSQRGSQFAELMTIRDPKSNQPLPVRWKIASKPLVAQDKKADREPQITIESSAMLPSPLVTVATSMAESAGLTSVVADMTATDTSAASLVESAALVSVAADITATSTSAASVVESAGLLSVAADLIAVDTSAASVEEAVGLVTAAEDMMTADTPVASEVTLEAADTPVASEVTLEDSEVTLEDSELEQDVQGLSVPLETDIESSSDMYAADDILMVSLAESNIIESNATELMESVVTSQEEAAEGAQSQELSEEPEQQAVSQALQLSDGSIIIPSTSQAAGLTSTTPGEVQIASVALETGSDGNLYMVSLDQPVSISGGESEVAVSSSSTEPQPADPGEVFMEFTTDASQQVAEAQVKGGPVIDIIPRSVKFRCGVCDKVYSQRGSCIRHMKLHTGNSFDCQICHVKCEDKASLAQHAQDVHQGHTHGCTHCPATFKTQAGMTEHINGHENIYRYRCPFCDKGLQSKSQFVYHLNTHTGNRPYACTTCEKSFSYAHALERHKNSCQVTEKSLSCPKCPAKFRQDRYLKEHMKTNHSEPEALACDICGKTFRHRGSVLNHKKKCRIH